MKNRIKHVMGCFILIVLLSIVWTDSVFALLYTGGSGDGYASGSFDGSNVYTWTGASDATDWTDQGNWDIGDGSAGNDGYPNSALDKVVINTTAHSIATGGAVTVGEIEISGNFSGTVTSGGTLTIDDLAVWDGNLTISVGTLDANNQTLVIDGNTVISGGILKTGTGAVTFGNAPADTVTVSSGTLDIESDATDTDITLTAGTWTNSGGTIRYLGSSSTTIFSSIATYNHLILNAGSATLTSNTTIDINGDLTISAGTLNMDTNDNNLTLAGSWSNAGTFSSGSGTVTFDGTASVTVDTGGTGAGQDFNNVIINKTSGTDANDNVTFQTNAVLINGTFTVTDGELVQSGVNLTTGTMTVAAAGQWTNTSDGDVTLSGDVANAGTISFDATTGSPDGITLRSSVSGTRRNWQGAGTFMLTDVDVKDMSAIGGTPASISVSSGTNSGNNINWFFGGSVTIGGTVYTDKTATTALANMPLTLVHYNGSVQTIYTTTANGSGVFSVPMTTAGDGDPVVIYINDAGGGQEGVLIYKSDSDGASNLQVFKDAVSLRGDSTSAITNSDLSNVDDADNDIKYSVTGGNATFEDNFEVFIFSGSTYTPGGTVELQNVDINGTFNTAGNDVTVSGNWDATGGTFTSGSNLVTFDGTTTLVTGGVGDGNDFNNITVTGTLTPSTDAIDIDGNLTIGGVGTLSNTNNLDISVAGNWANSGTFTSGTATVTIDGSGTTVISGNNTFSNFSSTTAGKAITFTAGTTQTVNGTFTLTGTSGNLITLRSSSQGNKWDVTFPNGVQNVTFVDVEDSDANTNTVTCLDCNNENNNNANWIFTSSSAITYPSSGKTVDTTPTVVGTGNASDTIQILDKDNNVVGSTTIDANGNFAVEVSVLAVGANSLTPKVGATSGTMVNITVEASPAASAVPVIISPVTNERMHGSKPTVSGEGQVGQTVTIKARDENNSLLLSTVGSGTVDSAGNYSVTLTTALPKGTNYLFVIVNDVGSTIITTKFTDPFGVVFDSSSNAPIEGAVVTIFKSDGTKAVVGTDLDPGDVNPVTTGSDGFYSFLTADNDYYITVESLGYTYPSTLSSFPAGRTIVIGSKGETFTVAGTIIEMDHPVNANGQQLIVIKDANKKDVVVGDIVTYTVTVENPTAADAPAILLEDRTPAGFKYVDGRTILDGVVLSDPSGARPLVFSIGTVSAGQTRTLKYQLVVGSGVSPGSYENVAWARYSGGRIVSNTASEEVRVVLDPTFDLGTVIGRVYFDHQSLDVQHPESNDPHIQPLLGGIRIVTEDGTIITTDEDGKFSVPGLLPGRHLFRLDERTLPPGRILTTKKVVLMDIRPGMLHKVNFGISYRSENKTDHKIDDHQDSKIQISRSSSILQPRLHVAVWPRELIIDDGGLTRLVEFYMFTNYGAFIERWQIDIMDADTGRVIHYFEGGRVSMNQSVIWDGKDKDGNFLNPDRRYEYVLTVYGAFLKKDRTKAIALAAGDWTSEAKKRKSSNIQDLLDDDKSQWLSTEQSKNSLDKQSILLTGETVHFSSVNEKQIIRIRQGNDVIDEHVINGSKFLTGRDVLGGEPNMETASAVDLILPNGNYTVEVVESDESGKASVRQDIQVGDDYLFFVGLGDAKMGYTMNTGNIEPVQSEDKFNAGFWSEGKAAYYLKGKVLGKYLITSSFDTERNRKEIFRQIDPDQYYPIYGDQSSVDYTAGDTQGMLFVLVEWDRSQVKWGNFQTKFTETEFAQFNRSLYGGRVELKSVADTPFNEPKQKLIVFQARAQQMSAHNEFIGTGGSLFYLKHKDIVQGSDQVRIEVRDKITGLVLSSETMRAGSDYELDEWQGRIQFRLPVSMLAESGSIISNEVLDGNPVYVVVDYAYVPKDKFDEGAIGVRATQAIGGNVRVGGTYVKESQPQKDYQLEGFDVTVRPNEKSLITFEYAESQSQSTGNFISTDGGLSFTELTTLDDASGQAWGIRAETRAFQRLGLTGYFKRIDRDFSTEAVSSQQGKELFGIGAIYDISDATRLNFRQDVQKLLDAGNSQTQLQVGAQKTSTTAMQIIHQIRRLRLTAEWRHQEVTEEIVGVAGETNRQGDTVAAGAEYQLDEKTSVSLKQQLTLSGEETHLTTVGVKRKLTDKVTVTAQQSAGSKGAATKLAASTDITDSLQLRAEYAKEQPVSGDGQNSVAVGADVKVNEDTSLNTTGGLMMAGGGTQSTFSFGGVKKLTDDMTWRTKHVLNSSDSQTTKDTTYELARAGAGRQLQASLTERTAKGSDESAQTHIFGLSGDVNEKWSVFGNYERGEVQNHDLQQFDRHAVSTGVGFVDRDKVSGRIKINTVSKVDVRIDEGVEDKYQYNIRQTLEGRPTEDITLYAKAEVSKTKNTTLGSTDEEFKKFVTGFAYRPIKFDRLNLLGRYTYLESHKPQGQIDSADIQREAAHVFSGEAIFDITDQWQLTEKFAYRSGEEQVVGFDWTESQTWLSAQGLSYKWNEDWRIYAEYRLLRQKQARDYKQGVHVELSRNFGELMNVGVGYDLTDFTDDLTDLDYTAHGPFLRVTGAFYDRSLEEIQRAKTKIAQGASARKLREEKEKHTKRLYKEITQMQQETKDLKKSGALTAAKEKKKEAKKLLKKYRQAKKYLKHIDAEVKSEEEREAEPKFLKKARMLYEKGTALFEKGLYVEAKVKFKELLALQEHLH